jgi:hypothetical protein
MKFFVLFIVGAVIIGAGAMLSPAWPTKQPRIGLAATFSLALIVGGAVWWAEMFGWSTLVIDYLLFALVSIVILGGTMAQAQERAESRGEELLDEDMGWPGPEDLAFFAISALLASVPLLILNLPLGAQAAADAMVTLAARDGGTFTSLAPFYPKITSFTPPGFHAITAYLSAQLHQPIPMIHMAVGSVVAFLCVWMAYDLGAEIKDKRLGRAMALAMIGSPGIANLLFNSQYSQLMGILFAMAFMTYVLRYYRHHLLLDMIAAGLLLGAVLYVSPMLFFVVFISYYLWLIALHIPIRRQASKTIAQWTVLSWIGLWFGVLAVCAFGVVPWVWNNWQFIGQYSEYGIVEIAISTILMTFVSGYIILWLFERMPLATRQFGHKNTYTFMIISLIIFSIVVLGIRNQEKSMSNADIAAMDWLIANIAEDALIANYPYPIERTMDAYESSPFPVTWWVTSYVGREAIYSPYYWLNQSRHERNDKISEFWFSDVDNSNLLIDVNVDYVFMPSGFELPHKSMLQLVFEQDGARVYRVLIGE